MFSGKDHHDKITAKIIKASTISIREKKALILAKCHDQELHELAMLEEVLIQFRNKFHNFRNSITISMNF
jgi:hypothetical protein